MSSESDWLRVETEEREEAQSPLFDVKSPTAPLSRDEELATESTRNPFSLQDLPEYSLFYDDGLENQLLKVPSGSLSASSDVSTEIKIDHEQEIESILCSIEQVQARQYKMFVFASISLLVLALSIALTWATRIRHGTTKIELCVPDTCNLIEYGNKEIHEQKTPLNVVQIVWAKYARCFMNVLRISQLLVENWKNLLWTNAEFIHRD